MALSCHFLGNFTAGQWILFDPHGHAFQAFGGVPGRGTYHNIRTALDQTYSTRYVARQDMLEYIKLF